jgi:ribose-phosphate pyrophosphokinase
VSLESPATRELVVFSGSAHPEFAAELCSTLGVELSEAHIERFSNDCIQVQLGANCRQRDVYIVQPLVPPVQEHLMELLLMLDAARGASAAQITAIIPHYAYARSDKKDQPRISIGGRLVADLLATSGANRVLTMALHAPQVHGFFSVPVDHLNAIGELAEHFQSQDLSNSVVVSPDLGNAKPASALARLLGVPVAAGSKRRLADDKVVIDTIVGDVEGRDVIVLDDEIANGGTIMELLNKLREHNVGRISLAFTHGLFTGKAIQRLAEQTDVTEIVTTNTVPLAPEKRLPNIEVLSVAPLFAETIRRIHFGESVSSLFSGTTPAVG